jgi:CTP:molybdopterin cytidylyltransferase MocA/xanthine/CO dehydrogenase XdhC/CoxF family maturation factor
MRRATLEHLIAMRQGGRTAIRALDVETGEESLIDPTDLSPLGRAAAAAMEAGLGGRVMVDGRSWFLTIYDAPWEIVIIGAVHIAQALAAIAPPAGFRVRVIDPRAAYATEERFAGITLDRRWPDEALAAEPLSKRSALVALAHDPKLDDAALIGALRSPAGYIGALGSSRTHAKRLTRLAAAGFSASELARIHGPVGLSIGARSPSEIAIAILAELVQCRRAPAAVRIGGVVLAAGLSSRMGRNKLILPLGGKPIVRHAVEAALASRLDPVLVVTGNDPTAIKRALDGLAVTFVHNADFAKGLSTSLHKGIAALPADCAGALVLLGDMPGITQGLIDRVIAGFANSRTICVATAKGQRGHPVLWGRQFFPQIQALTGDAGARALMAAHADAVCEIAVDDGAILTDIDTEADLQAYSASQENRPL